MPKSPQETRLLKRLKREAPEVLEAEVDFDAVTERLLKAPQADREAVAKAAARARKRPKK